MLIREPVHGDLYLNPVESAVLECPEVQRLRGIKQLGTAYLVYPGALHTRFDHSLGVCALSHRIVQHLRAQGLHIAPEIEQIIGVAALLHDVTHIPFGHTLEDERRLFPRHDQGSRWNRLVSGPLGDTLDRFGILEPIQTLLNPAIALTGSVAGPIPKQKPGPTDNASVVFQDKRLPCWAQQIVSSTIDADLLDYLRRDARFTGLATHYDDRIFQYFTVVDGQLALNMVKHGMDRPDARSEVIQLLRTRYFLTERVYFHHTKITAGAMVSKAVEALLESEELSEEDLLSWEDAILLDRLEHSRSALAQELAHRVRRRALYKRGYVVSSLSVDEPTRHAWVKQYHLSRSARAIAENEIASALQIPASEVIVYCPALTVMKEANATINSPSGVRPLNDPKRADFAEIAALEARYADLWRFYVFVPESHRRAAAIACSEYFGHADERTLE